jgi:hypothetical protein
MFHPKHVEQLAGNKNSVQKCHLVGTFLKLVKTDVTHRKYFKI